MKNKHTTTQNINNITNQLRSLQLDLNRIIQEIEQIKEQDNEDIIKLDISAGFLHTEAALKIGDKVRTSKGKYKCKTGTVTHINKNGTITVRLDTGQTTWRKQHNVHKI